MEIITSLIIIEKSLLINLTKILKHISHFHDSVIIKHANDKLVFVARNHEETDCISYTIHLKQFSYYQIRFSNKQDFQFSINVCNFSMFVAEILESTNNAILTINFIKHYNGQCKK